jgi:hypothetical protein
MIVSKEETLEAVKDSTAMPDWAKAMATQTLDNIDFAQMAVTIATTRIKHLKELLGSK